MASAHCGLALNTHRVSDTILHVWSVWNIDSSLSVIALTAFPINTSSCLALWTSGPHGTDEIQMRWNRKKSN